jgi:predicted  nucleic acid-binding Zn-ribbon protein
MPFLPAAAIVNAATASTKKYLAFLIENEANLERHRANNICSVEDQTLLLENSIWIKYQCELPQHRTIRSDSSATLIDYAAPGSKIEIHILEYDRRTGKTEFASQTPVHGTTGDIVIDFRWLVQRCLEWLQQRGSSVSAITKIKPYKPANPNPLVMNECLSNEQCEAIKTVLSTGLSYIWGPPGTGKTMWVLAKAVHICVERKEKILVLASTNLAVDNALSAILKDGVPQTQVARIGVPSASFIQEYPDCCEERAFQHEIRQIKSQIKTLEDNITSLQRMQKLVCEIEDCKAELTKKRSELNKVEAKLVTIQHEILDNENIIHQWSQEQKRLESEHKSKQGELNNIAFAKLLSDIEAMECEQAQTIKELARLNKELIGLGIFTRIFTGRKQELINSISELSAHLRSVEVTIESMREKRVKLEPIFTQLKAEKAKLESAHEKAHKEIIGLKVRVSGLEQMQRAQQKTASGYQENIQFLENRIEVAAHNLSDIGKRYPTDNSDELLVTWRADKEQLEARLFQFKQDLASKSVLGMTLDGFIGLTLQTNIIVNHVFIDEAPYAPIAKILPLLSLHCPIAMLGDHLQLPPICECKNDETIQSYWEKPAIFLEDAFRLGDHWKDLHMIEEPILELTQRCILHASYRFGQSLASLLDRHIYNNIGLVGLSNDDTYIRSIHCEPQDRADHIGRENYAEANTILKHLAEWWDWALQQPSLPTIAILTPYKKQVSLIRNQLRVRFGDTEISNHVEVWNTHKAQGREWDWVLFSVSDTANLPGNAPYFSDSNDRTGRAVLNTTISRTKKHLRIFLDLTYWEHRLPQSLLTELAQLNGNDE